MFSRNSIASVILTGTILITGTTAAYAVKGDESPRNAPKPSISTHFNSEKMHTRVKSALDGLVKEGTITKAQKDAVLKEIETKIKKFKTDGKGHSADGQRKGPLNDLINAGTLTQAQADAIKDAFKSARDSGKTIKEVLDSLVKAGTITPAQQDAVTKILPCKDGKCTLRDHKHGFLRDLVKAGTITQEQADAIKEAIKSAKDTLDKTE